MSPPPAPSVSLNVPSWRGKRFLEFSAFRLGLSPAEEIRGSQDLLRPARPLPLLTQAGFRPHEIECYKHKFGLNTFAACRMPS